jgi:hypothetical protein
LYLNDEDFESKDFSIHVLRTGTDEYAAWFGGVRETFSAGDTPEAVYARLKMKLLFSHD